MADDGPRISVWHGETQRFGYLGKASPWANVVGRIEPGGSPLYTAAYEVNDGPFTPLVLGPSAYRLRDPGDFNVEVPLSSLRRGMNSLLLQASDEAGNVTRKTVRIDYGGMEAWPLPYTIDWSSVGNLQDVVQVIDGSWAISSEGIRPTRMAYDRLVALGDLSWNHYEVSTTFTIHGYESTPAIYGWPSYGPAVGLLLGWGGHADWGDMVPRRGYYPHGTIGVYRWRRDGPMRRDLWAGYGNVLIAAEETGASDPELNRPYCIKMRSEARPGERNHYSLKIWPEDREEPVAWDLAGQGAPGGRNTGGILLLAHHTDVTFGEIRVIPLSRN